MIYNAIYIIISVYLGPSFNITLKYTLITFQNVINVTQPRAIGASVKFCQIRPYSKPQTREANSLTKPN